MDKTKLAHIVTTALFAVAILPGAVGNLAQPEVVVEIAGNVGIPLALLSLVGVWKLLGVVALATPGFERIKEWAYAGFFFDLTGAAVLHAAAGDYAGIAPPTVLALLLGASYWLRAKSAKSAKSAEHAAVAPQPSPA